MGESQYTDIHTFKVDQAGVQILIHSLHPPKADGPDHISSTFLKGFAAELAPSMNLIFQASLRQGEVADGRKQANVTPHIRGGRPK